MKTRIAKGLVFLSFSLLLLGCKPKDAGHPAIITGKEYDEHYKTVVDTTSSFYINDEFKLRLNRGQEFGTSEIMLEVYQIQPNQSERRMYIRKLKVDRGAGHLILQGKKGKSFTARNFFVQKLGHFKVRFLSDTTLIAEKIIEVKKHKKQSK